jgi:hypothetical protein
MTVCSQKSKNLMFHVRKYFPIVVTMFLEKPKYDKNVSPIIEMLSTLVLVFADISRSGYTHFQAKSIKF